MTFSIMTLSIMTNSITTISIMTVSIVTNSIMTLSQKNERLSMMTLTTYGKCQYAKYRLR